MEKDVVIAGLGPGGLDTLSVGTLEILKNARKLWIRTRVHPVVNALSGMGIEFGTFDHLYERSGDFCRVYSEIAETVVKEAMNGPVVFAVPGHPLVGEDSVHKILDLAAEQGLTCEILPAMSFIDPALTALRVNITDGLKVIDGLSLVAGGNSPKALPDPRVATLVMQVYSRLVASEVKLSLMEFYPDKHMIKVIRAAGVPNRERTAEIPLFELDRLDWIDHLTSVYIPPFNDSASMVSRFPLDSLVDLLEKLRDIDGCPWDREQTHITLKKYLVEETYEVLDAIDEGNMYKVCEELGDLLLQIVFHAQIARESGHFDMNDVVRSISEKIVRRHPHIFGNVSVTCSEEVSANWEEIKKEELEEKGEVRRSLLDGIPQSMPALAKAEKIQRKAAKVGFDWPDYRGALDKVAEETAEIKEAADSGGNPDRVKDEIGDLLFAVVNLARLLRTDPEDALLLTIRKFRERFMYMESLAAEAQTDLNKMDLDALDRLWEEAKIHLKGKKT